MMRRLKVLGVSPRCVTTVLLAFGIWLCRSLNNFSWANAFEVLLTMCLVMLCHGAIITLEGVPAKVRAISFVVLIVVLLTISKLTLYANIMLDDLIINKEKNHERILGSLGKMAE